MPGAELFPELSLYRLLLRGKEGADRIVAGRIDAEAERRCKEGLPPEKDDDEQQEGEEDGKTDDKNVPMEPGSKSDYQFNQALNLLKGLQILRK